MRCHDLSSGGNIQRNGRITGTGSYIPSYCMDNNDIAKLVETSDEWIQERTGVARRHIITNETTVSMAAEAGKRALENANVRPEEVDLILVSTISSNVILPCAACEVQKEIGALNATCFDLYWHIIRQQLILRQECTGQYWLLEVRVCRI